MMTQINNKQFEIVRQREITELQTTSKNIILIDENEEKE